jgi:putative hydroxymethylpyrimidine transport system substrate-binding protein
LKRFTLLPLALFVAMAVAACGTKSEDVNPVRDPLSVAMDWYPNPDHAGFLVAQDQGYFEDAGLDVSLDSPSDPSLPIKLVAAGKADLALSYEPEVLLAREQGLDVVSVATVVGQPLTSMIWLKKSKIKRVKDLKGKTISTAGISYQDAYLKTILARAGLSEDDVKKVGVGQGLLPSIVSGRAQATLGPFWNIEGVELKQEGLKPTINPVDKLGVPTYSEMVLVAKGSRIQDDPDPIRLFITALARGTRFAVAHPNQATQSVLKANDALKPKITAAQMKATLPLLNQDDNQNASLPFGHQDRASWQTFINWMVDQGVLANSQRAVDALTNALLPTSQVNVSD